MSKRWGGGPRPAAAAAEAAARSAAAAARSASTKGGVRVPLHMLCTVGGLHQVQEYRRQKVLDSLQGGHHGGHHGGQEGGNLARWRRSGERSGGRRRWRRWPGSSGWRRWRTGSRGCTASRRGARRCGRRGEEGPRASCSCGMAPPPSWRRPLVRNDLRYVGLLRTRDPVQSSPVENKKVKTSRKTAQNLASDYNITYRAYL